jgi:hypothetical protein
MVWNAANAPLREAEPVCCYPGCPACDEAMVPPDTCKKLVVDVVLTDPIGADTRRYDPPKQPLNAKLRTFDALADAARDELVRLLTEEWEYVKRLAAGRHASGHFLYGDALMYEYDQARLLVESVEELADGVNYTVVRLSRGGDSA